MNQFGCSNSITNSVNVLPVLTDFNFTKLDSLFYPQITVLKYFSGASSYIWTFDTIANSIQSDPFSHLIVMVFMS